MWGIKHTTASWSRSRVIGKGQWTCSLATPGCSEGGRSAPHNAAREVANGPQANTVPLSAAACVGQCAHKIDWFLGPIGDTTSSVFMDAISRPLWLTALTKWEKKSNTGARGPRQNQHFSRVPRIGLTSVARFSWVPNLYNIQILVENHRPQPDPVNS